MNAHEEFGAYRSDPFHCPIPDCLDLDPHGHTNGALIAMLKKSTVDNRELRNRLTVAEQIIHHAKLEVTALQNHLSWK